jgi:hypothetical protein
MTWIPKSNHSERYIWSLGRTGSPFLNRSTPELHFRMRQSRASPYGSLDDSKPHPQILYRNHYTKTMADPEPTDPHPGQRVDIEELILRKYSEASNWSGTSSKGPSTASSAGSAVGERTWKDFTTSETWSQNGEGVEVHDFAHGKGGGEKSKAEVEKSQRMSEKSSLM